MPSMVLPLLPSEYINRLNMFCSLFHSENETRKYSNSLVFYPPFMDRKKKNHTSTATTNNSVDRVLARTNRDCCTLLLLYRSSSQASVKKSIPIETQTRGKGTNNQKRVWGKKNEIIKNENKPPNEFSSRRLNAQSRARALYRPSRTSLGRSSRAFRSIR